MFAYAICMEFCKAPDDNERNESTDFAEKISDRDGLAACVTMSSKPNRPSNVTAPNGSSG